MHWCAGRKVRAILKTSIMAEKKGTHDNDMQQRLQKHLQGAFSGPPTPLKEVPTRSGKKRAPRKDQMPRTPSADRTAAIMRSGFVEAKRLTIVISKIELCQIAMQMLLRAMLINAAHPSFED